jgi:hypothetical protein
VSKEIYAKNFAKEQNSWVEKHTKKHKTES